VFFLAVVRELVGVVMRVFRVLVEEAIYLLGSVRGEIAELDVGHSRVKPAGNCASGVTRKLRFEIAL
jgi:hypothetical protein